MKVAILKHRIYKGGVSQVLASMIKVLNEKGIVPDLITFRSDIDEKIIGTDYGQEIKFNVRKIFFDVKMPYEWNFIFFNFISRFYIKEYDLLINSNNTSFLAPISKNTITYLHFPRKSRAVSTLKNLHVPESGNKSFFDFSFDPFFIAFILYRMNNGFHKRETVVCNSKFTRRNVEEVYGTSINKIQVLYPPVDISGIEKIQKKKNTVISLGRFSEDKRQLEQIAIAAGVPSMEFTLCGFKGDGVYFSLCENEIQRLNLKNVHLVTDANYNDIRKMMAETEFFLHNVRNEPFGISTVQAIAAGCIPVVHRSGGSQEIVGEDEFLFSGKEEAIEKLKALDGKAHQIIDISPYGKSNFEKGFMELLENTKH